MLPPTSGGDAWRGKNAAADAAKAARAGRAAGGDEAGPRGGPGKAGAPGNAGKQGKVGDRRGGPAEADESARAGADGTVRGGTGEAAGAAAREAAGSGAAAAPVLLAGGNPQIAKGYGDAPVAAFIAAMPGWKRAVGARLDALVVATVPGVVKAVKWNSPLYGVAGDGWFMAVHCYARYVKVAFFRGARLVPPPPVASKSGETRYIHLGEDEFDAARLADWIAQASRLPGEKM